MLSQDQPQILRGLDMLVSDLNDLMFSPELFKVYVSVNRPLKGQVFELPSLFNLLVTQLCSTWTSTAHGELTIRSEMYQKKIRVLFLGCPSRLFYVDEKQLADIQTLYENISNAAMERVIHQT